jgi:hypothetical protein
MTDSFAGISVPEGSVGDLRSTGSRLIQQAQVLTDSATSLQAMPSAGSWTGPARGAEGANAQRIASRIAASICVSASRRASSSARSSSSAST